MAVLYRKYRSRSLKELVGQNHITDSLMAAIKNGNISHAYLFTGPRGTGKTSVARIIAHQINDIEYDDPCSHIDIIEIDAASNRRIDEIRELRDKVHIAPALTKYKVYIIDEVHMLTREAFNALLKTLEEPPEHVIFILATTELHKVPETIVSRTQRHTFKPIAKQDLVEHLRNISNKESINVDDDALELIAEHANGGFRDAISLLDQVSHHNSHISTDSVSEVLGVPPHEAIKSLWLALSKKDGQSALLLKKILAQGFHAPMVSRSLLKMAVESGDIEIARDLLNVSGSIEPSTELLLCMLKHDGIQIETPITKSEKVTVGETEVSIKPVLDTKVESESKEPDVTTNSEETPAVKQKNRAKTDIDIDSVWSDILESIKNSGHAVYGPLRLAEVKLTDGVLHLSMKFPFHVKRVTDANNMKAVKEAYRTVTGNSVEIEVHRQQREQVMAEKSASLPSQSIKVDEEQMNDPLSLIKHVFGGAELL